MLSDIIGEFTGGITERIGELLGGDAATTEQAVDASAPALVAGLADATDHDPDAVYSLVTAGEVDGDTVAAVAFGDRRGAVTAAIAEHLAAPADAVSGVVATAAAGVASYLRGRISDGDLDAEGLAALLWSARTELGESGVAPMLASWGIGGLDPAGAGEHAHAHGGDDGSGAGFQYDDDAGRPSELWWLTGIITLVLFAIAIAQCGTTGGGIDAGPAMDTVADATEATTAATTAPTTTAAPSLGLLADVAAEHGRLSTLINLADQAGLTGALVGDGPRTIFAPTDEAFSELPAAVLDGLAADPDTLQSLLLAHIADGRLLSTDLQSESAVTMLSGDIAEIEISPGVAIGGASVIDPDLEADNGVIHVVDRVIVPDGFDLPGLSAGLSIIDLATSAGEFATLLTALDAAGLTSVLEGDDVYTLFGPTDEAFAALPDGTVDALLERPDDLDAVVTYHVVEGEFLAEDLTAGTELTTVQGETLVVGGSGTAVEIGRATVIAADVRAGNGVIHVTDAVLLPRSVFPSGEPTINYVLALQPITFATASATITPEGEEVLDLAVAYLLENPVPVEIQGHTDSDGEEDANQALSEARAQSVLDYLVANGVDADLLIAVGFGETQPIADNATDEGKAQNRRIEFRVIG
jgi:uncharacterized surface protein with fasciclin (FAS1) repeats